MIRLVNLLSRTIFPDPFAAMIYRAEINRHFNTKSIFLFVIIFVSLSALSFNFAQYQDLRQSMHDPFTNLIDYEIPAGSTNTKDIVAHFRHDTIKSDFNLLEVKPYEMHIDQFLLPTVKGWKYMKGKSVEADEQIMTRILSQKGGEWYSCSKSKDSVLNLYGNCGMIVTEKMLEELNYKGSVCDAKNLIIVLDEDKNQYLQLPIAAVVKFLPDKVDFILKDDFTRILSTPVNRNRSINLYGSMTKLIGQDTTTLDTLLTAYQLINKSNYTTDLTAQQKLLGYNVTFNTGSDKESLLSQIEKMELEDRPLRLVDYECYYADKTGAKYFNGISFYFDNLEKIVPFRDSLKKLFQAEISLKQIESSRNFSRVTNLAFVGIIGLFFFSIIAVIVYLASMLSSHLNSEARSIGTIIAFGVSKKSIKKVYLAVFLSICVTSILISLVLIYLFSLVSANIYISWVTILATILIISAAVILINLTLSTLLSHSPSKLIRT
jgi:hypothetical protein